MKISSELAHFDGQRAILLVASPALIELYEARNSKIALLETVTIEKAEFSDKEGYFQNSSRGGWKVAASSGSQLVKRDLEQRFEKEFKSLVKKSLKASEIDSLYVFVPSYFSEKVESLLSNPLKKKVKLIFKGNYHKLHPFDLLKKVGKTEKTKRGKVDVQNIPQKKSGNEIIKNSRIAKAVIKNPKSFR
jgi:hypothetical protein